MDEIIYEEDAEETKEEEPKEGSRNGHTNETAVDADLFNQEAADGEEEEPDFD